MKLALVHDWLNQYGGAERVLEQLVALYPDAPIFTSIYAHDLLPETYTEWDIRTTWLDKLPAIHTHHQPYFPLYPLAFGALDLSAYDVILSNKSGFCHGVIKGDALHICYCLAPTRYVWQYDAYMERERVSKALSMILRPAIEILRRWDLNAARHVDHFVAISSDIQGRIKRFYDRDSVIIYPPVDVNRYQPSPIVEEYYLVVSRLIPYKRIDLAVQACTQLALPLLVAGTGRENQWRALP
jgi:glycosyltransferase involved in cell wall biosynthesis